MWHDFRPKDLGQTAHKLDVEPFEVIRLMVASGQTRDSFTFDRESVAALASFAGIERWWDSWSPNGPHEQQPKQAIVLAMLQRLLKRGFVGNKQTRQDNLWRGLPPELRHTVEVAVDVLIEDGTLRLRATESGLKVSIREDALETFANLASGQGLPDEITQLWAS